MNNTVHRMYRICLAMLALLASASAPGLRAQAPADFRTYEVELPGNFIGESRIDSIGYGPVELGRCREQIIEFINPNPEPVTIFASFLEGNGEQAFNLTELIQDIYIGPGERHQVPIRFCPNAVGTISATYVLTDALNPFRISYVKLEGIGVVANLEAPDSVIFEVNVPGCHYQPILVQNKSPLIVKILGFELGSSDQGFELVQPTPFDTLLLPDQQIAVGVRYCASAPAFGETDLIVHYMFDGQIPRERSMRLTGVGRAHGDSSVMISRSRLDFGDVEAGQCKRDSFTIKNLSGFRAVFQLQDIVPFPNVTAPTPFAIVSPPISSMPISVEIGDSLSVVLEYCPTQARGDSAFWIGQVICGYGVQYPIALTGRGVARPPTDTAHVSLDRNVPARVGEPVRLAVNISRFAGRASASWDSAVVAFDPRSLVLLDAGSRSGADEIIRVADDGAGVATIRRISGAGKLTGDTVITLEFVGLSTAQPHTYVTIRSISFSGLSNLEVDSVGSIRLTGCDLGRNLQIGLKGSIRSIQQERGSRDMMMLYRSPEGTRPRVVIYDMTGMEVTAFDLGEGDGNEQAFRLALGAMPPGYYVVELRSGDDRTALPIFIPQ